MPKIIEVTVKSQKGKCGFGHKVGDKIIFDSRSVKGEICQSALMVLLPKVYAMRHGVRFPYAKDKWTKDVIFQACPDPKNPVVFEIRRVRKRNRSALKPLSPLLRLLDCANTHDYI